MFRKTLLAFGVVPFLILSFAFSGGSAFAAAIPTDPLVTIAVDLTSSSCMTSKSVTYDVNPTHRLETRSHCLAGTQMGIVLIPLSLAKAHHDVYLMPLPASASPNAKVQWFSQIDQLMVAKRNALQSAYPHTIRPNSCGYNGSSSTGGTFFGTYISFDVYYHVSLNCASVTINREEVTGYNPVNTSAYWTEVKYSYYDKTCPVHYNYIGANDLNSYPGVTYNAGLYNVWKVAQGNTCFGGNGGAQEFNVGPL